MPRRPLLALVAALLVALLGGLWWFARSDSASESVEQAAPGRALAAAGEPRADPVLQAADPDAARELAPSAPERSAIAGVASTSDASALESAPPKPGVVELTGRVESAAGAPIAGARVSASAGGGGIELGLAVGGDDSPFPGARRAEGVTDAEGRFRISGAQSGRQRITVRAARFAAHQASDVLVPSGTSHDLGTIVLEPGGVLTGRVVDRRGAPVAGAHLRQVVAPPPGAMLFTVGGLKPSVELAQSASDGGFLIDTLPVGPFELRVWHDEFPDRTVEGEVLAPGQTLASLSIVLDDGASIAGRVTGVPPGMWSELSVRAVPKRVGGGLEIVDFDFGAPQGGDVRAAKLAADGSFEVRGLRVSEEYGLGVRRDRGSSDFDFGQRLSARVEARAGERGVELALRPESSLVFQVVDARTRQPIEKLRVSVGLDFPLPLPPPSGGFADRFPEGRVRAGNLRPRRPDDRAMLRIQSVGYRDWSRDDIALREGGELDLGVIELQPTPVVSVTVLDDRSGEPIRGARVALRKARESQPRAGFGRAIAVSASMGDDEVELEDHFGGDESRRGRTDEHGLARVTSLDGERCELTVTHAKYAPYTGAPFVCSLEGDAFTVRLREGGVALVTLLSHDGEPIAGGRVERRAADLAREDELILPGGDSSAVTDARGVARFEHLAEGVHEFRPASARSGLFGGGGAVMVLSGMEGSGGEGWERVEVREGAVSELTLRAPLKVRVSGVVTEGGGALAAATVSLERKTEGRERLPRLPFGGGPSVRTDARGHYELVDVEPGEYTLTVSHSARAMGAELELRVGTRDTRFDVALSIAVVEGRVVDSDDKPLAGVRVSAERHREGAQRSAVYSMAISAGSGGVSVLGGESGGAAEVLTDADGRFALRGVATDTPLVVRAEGKGLQPARSQPFEVGENEVKRNVRLSLARGGQLEVSVFNADGSAAQMVVITATPQGETAAGAERKTGFIQDDGKTVLDGLAPGAWRVAARPVGLGAPERGAQQVGEQVIEVRPGETSQVRFDLP